MTFDVVTRYSRAELPYALAFHEHYTNAGANQIFYILSDPRSQDSVGGELKQMLRMSSYDNFQLVFKTAEPNMALSMFSLSLLESRYFISIDMDEYISSAFLGTAISDLIDSSKQGYINIGWKISCSDFSLEQRKRSYPSSIGKVAAKTSLVDSINGPHTLRLKSGAITSPKHKVDRIDIIHYWARSFDDILLKCIYQRFPNEKYVRFEHLVNPRNCGLPMRLKLLAYMQKCAKTDENQDYLSHLSNESLAKDMALSSLGSKNYVRLWMMYDSFKQSIASDVATELCKWNGPLALAKRIQQNG